MSVKRPDVLTAFRRAESRRTATNVTPRSLIVESFALNGPTYAAVDADGYWALVVEARYSDRPTPSVKLSSLSADYGASYVLHVGEGVEAVRVCIIRCTTDDPSIRELFATFCGAVAEGLSPDPSDSEVEGLVNSWIALFWHLQSPARTTVIGLIGELTILDSVEHVIEWVQAWHSDVMDNLDFAFSSPALSVEVKATVSQQRVHNIGIHQALPALPDRHHFASVIVELRESGVRVGDVVDEIASQLAGTDEAEQFWRALATTCGASLSAFFDIRYMRDVSINSLRFYPASAIPQPTIETPLPAGVSDVRFRSDFTSVEPTNSAPILGFTQLAAPAP